MANKEESNPVVTTYEAAQAVRLQKVWQEQYRARAKEVMQKPTSEGECSVGIVGRAGVGKGTLVNHLLKQRVATVSHNVSGNDSTGWAYNFGRLKLIDIPGYDGQHSLASQYRTKKDRSKPEGTLSLEEFVEAYKLFGSEMNALIFVVNNRITVQDKELMAMAIASRKFFCIVRTNADTVAGVVDEDERVARLNEMEQEIRDELDLTKNLNIRIFKVSIPWPESRISGDELKEADLEYVSGNAQALDFPLLASYLSEPGGLYEEPQIHRAVGEFVAASLEPYIHVKKGRLFNEFSRQAVLGVLVPVIGNHVLLTFVTTLIHTVHALGAVGLVEDTEKSVGQIVDTAKHNKPVRFFATKVLIQAFENTLIAIFGRTIYDIAIYELASIAAVGSMQSVPIVGAVVATARLPHRYHKIGDVLYSKACMLHELYIMQNITDLTRL